MRFTTLQISLACVFVAMVVASLLITSNAIHLLSMAYAVTNQVTVSGAALDLNNSNPSKPKLVFTMTIENPTATNLHLAYIRLSAYVYELSGRGDLLLNRDLVVRVYDPRLLLPTASNTTLSVETTDVEAFLSIDPPKYWFVTIYLHVPDAPLLGNRAILRRYASFETSF